MNIFLCKPYRYLFNDKVPVSDDFGTGNIINYGTTVFEIGFVKT